MSYKLIYYKGYVEIKDLDKAFTGISNQPNLSIPKYQIDFKAIYQAFVEEISELMQFINANTESKVYKEGTLDEVADCFNFATLMFIRSGLTFKSIPQYLQWPNSQSNFFTKPKEAISLSLFSTIINFGMVCNILKNRPWKHSNYPLDIEEFRIKVLNAYISFLDCLTNLGIPESDLEIAINRKIEVNYKRLKQNY